MTGFDSRIRSPSTLRRTRRTPCVLGCWGPRLISISVVWNIARSSLSATRPSGPVVLVVPGVSLEGVVLEERMPLPVVRQQDPRQIRMAGERDAEHVEGLALVPVRGLPDGGDRWNGLPLGDLDLQLDPLSAIDRVEVVDDLERLVLLVGIVRAME